MNLKNIIENHIIADMTQRQVKYLQVVRPDQANGMVADIYQQARKDFQVLPPITLFSPVPDLLAGLWSIVRESYIVTTLVSRQNKEAIAASVSSINTCPYCVDAHVGMLHGTSAHTIANAILESDMGYIDDLKSRALIEWALATRTPRSKLLDTPPFTSEQAPEIIGTALSYHFINRMVSIFLSPSPFPVNSSSKRLRNIATWIFGAMAGNNIVNKQVSAGDSLMLLPEAELPAEYTWAKSNSHISKAFAGFSALMESAGQETVPEKVRECLLQHLEKWQGEEMGLSRQWLEDAVKNLEKQHENIARLILLTAFAPYQLDEKIIASFRKEHPSDAELLAATCWASYATSKRISQWLIPTQTSTKEQQ